MTSFFPLSVPNEDVADQAAQHKRPDLSPAALTSSSPLLLRPYEPNNSAVASNASSAIRIHTYRNYKRLRLKHFTPKDRVTPLLNAQYNTGNSYYEKTANCVFVKNWLWSSGHHSRFRTLVSWVRSPLTTRVFYFFHLSAGGDPLHARHAQKFENGSVTA